MFVRSLLLATILLGISNAATAHSGDVIVVPVLRSSVVVTGEVVTIGDVVDNAGPMAQIAIYRAPDLGTTGSLPTARVLTALRAHQVIGVDTRGIQEVSVTRLARTLDVKDIETQVKLALEHRGGLGDAANLALTFDRDLQALQLDASNDGAMQPVSARYDARTGRFDVGFEIAGTNIAPARLRFTGTAVETIETAVLMRDIDRNEVLKSSDVVIGRRPKTEAGTDLASRDRAVGMQARKAMRAGQPLRNADLAKPDLVQRDQSVTIIYDSGGVYLTVRGKAIEGGTEGDVVNVMNLQSKRSVSGVVVGRGQVAVTVAVARPVSADASVPVSAVETPKPVSVAVNDTSVSRKAE